MNRSLVRSRNDKNEVEVVQDSGLVEQELAKLQRQYRIMEGDRKAYGEESQQTIRKQRATIDKLQRDNEYLNGELVMAESRSAELKDGDSTKRLQDLSSQSDQYQRKIKQETQRAEDLDKEIKEYNRKIGEQRRRMGGVNAASQNNIATQKQIRVLENRLDKALVKFNKSLAYNKQLRENIDSLRRERVVFDNIYKKLEKELVEQKKLMGEIIEGSNQAYEARDEAQAKMIALKEKAEKELTAYNMELKELTRILEHDKKLKSFMGLKSQDRSVKEQAVSEDLRSASKKKRKGNFEAGKDKAQQQTSQETVQSYEEAFAKIQEATGIQDIDMLVEKFIEVEDQNFSLFNYVNELNNEIEKLQEHIAQIRSDIERFKGQGVNMDNQRKKILKELEERLAATEQQADAYDQKYVVASKTVNHLKQGVQNLFQRIRCDKSAINDMLGNSGVTDTNMMQYLGIIEQRVNEMLQMYHFMNAKDTDKTEAAAVVGGLLGQGPQPPTGPVSILPPSTGDDYESDDDEVSDEDQRPLTRDELKMRTLRGIAKRENQPQKTKKGRTDRKKK